MRCTLLCIFLATAFASSSGANPIRKIVTLMQNMQKEIELEGAKEKKLFDEFMCWCKDDGVAVDRYIELSSSYVTQLTAMQKSLEAAKVQTAQDLIGHKKDREGAQGDMEEATVLRNKENTAYAAAKADMEYNIAAMGKAIPAIESGMGGAALLQTPGVGGLRKIIDSYSKLDTMDRRDAVAFLEGSTDYAPQSGQIVGILKAMKDDMEADLKAAVADEAKAVSGYGDLKASKAKEIEVATEAIEEKLGRSGKLAVNVVKVKDFLADMTAEYTWATKFKAMLEAHCGTKEKEFAEKSTLRAQEISAISEAISILNDDDALDVFKKTMPSSFAQQPGFLQLKDAKASKVLKAQAILAGLKSKDVNMKLLLFTLGSKLKVKSTGAGAFDEVIKMVDDMISLLGKQQAEDEKQKAFCQDELEKSADEEAATKTKIAQSDADLAEQTDAISSLMEDISELNAEIAELDKSAAEATEMRKEEHAEYLETVQMNEAATGLVKKAQQRLQKFYNPVLYKAAPKTEMTMEEKVITAGTFVQIRRRSTVVIDDEFGADIKLPKPFGDRKVPAFESFYQKKETKSAGVISMMDTIIKDLEADTKEVEYAEKTAQKEYAELMDDSQGTRASDMKSLTTKTAAKAEAEGSLMAAKEKRMAEATDLKLITTSIKELHVSCDFILQNGDLRTEARTNEIEALKNAKAVLAGASYSF
jgi:hypothetical protein